ncbi:MAG TPA: cation-transporting P-type ATPase, partial [Pyrinomonadaceae bacterium]|nr:cation-transporting P-type ATPase [Pyrinomonadaceae bacterium]
MKASIETQTLTGARTVQPVALQPEWHALETNALPSLLDVDPHLGLTSAQVNERQQQYGRNVLKKIQPRSAWRLLVD